MPTPFCLNFLPPQFSGSLLGYPTAKTSLKEFFSFLLHLNGKDNSVFKSI